MRRGPGRTCLVVIALTGCTHSSGEVPYRVSDVRLLSASTIEVAWSVCASGAGIPQHTVAQGADAVAVAMEGPDSFLPDEGETCAASVRINLDRPLGEREVIDGNTGRSVAVRYG